MIKHYEASCATDDPHAYGRHLPAYDVAMDELRNLEPGEAWEYYVDTGHSVRSHGVFSAAWDAHEKGMVSLVKKRRPDGRLAYLAVRR